MLEMLQIEFREIEPQDPPLLVDTLQVKLGSLYMKSKFLVLANTSREFAGLVVVRATMNAISLDVSERFQAGVSDGNC